MFLCRGQNTTFLSSSTNRIHFKFLSSLAPPAPSASQNPTNVNINNSYSTFPVTPYPNTVINVSIRIAK